MRLVLLMYGGLVTGFSAITVAVGALAVGGASGTMGVPDEPPGLCATGVRRVCTSSN